MSRETLSVFKEDARKRFCRRVLTAFRAEGYLLSDTEDSMELLINLSKQADSVHLKSEATQYSYMMLCILLDQDNRRIQALHNELEKLPKKEEIRLEYLDQQIDQELEYR